MQLKCGIVWLLIWIGIASAGRDRLAKIENEVDKTVKSPFLLSIPSLGLVV